MGFTGTQIADSDGVDVGEILYFDTLIDIFKNIITVGTDSKPTQEYKYLDGRCRHYKLIGESLEIEIFTLLYNSRRGSWNWTKSSHCSASDEGDDPRRRMRSEPHNFFL